MQSNKKDRAQNATTPERESAAPVVPQVEIFSTCTAFDASTVGSKVVPTTDARALAKMILTSEIVQHVAADAPEPVQLKLPSAMNDLMQCGEGSVWLPGHEDKLALLPVDERRRKGNVYYFERRWRKDRLKALRRRLALPTRSVYASVYSSVAWAMDAEVVAMHLENRVPPGSFMVTSLRAGHKECDAPRTPDRIRKNAAADGVEISSSHELMQELSFSEQYYFDVHVVADPEVCGFCGQPWDLPTAEETYKVFTESLKKGAPLTMHAVTALEQAAEGKVRVICHHCHHHPDHRTTLQFG